MNSFERTERVMEFLNGLGQLIGAIVVCSLIFGTMIGGVLFLLLEPHLGDDRAIWALPAGMVIANVVLFSVALLEGRHNQEG